MLVWSAKRRAHDDTHKRHTIPAIESRDDLLSVFAGGEKPRERWRIGTEHEKFVYRMSDHARRAMTSPAESVISRAASPNMAGNRSSRTAMYRAQRSGREHQPGACGPVRAVAARRFRTFTRPAPRRRVTSTSVRRSASGSDLDSSDLACGQTRRGPSCRSCPRAATRSCSITCRRSAVSAST